MITETAYDTPATPELLHNPGPRFDAALEARRPATAPAATPRTGDEGAYGKKPKQPAGPLLELSARHPYDAKGLIDVYEVGRWDSSTDTIYLKPIVQTGPSPGEWNGSVVYGRFTAPEAGTYEVVATFYGFQITMRMSAASGVTLGSSFDNVPATVAAQVTATAGQAVWFQMSCTGLYLGFLQKIQISKI